MRIPPLTPARLLAIATAVLALVAHYVDIPAPLVLGVIAAILGGGVAPAHDRAVETALATPVPEDGQ